MGFIVLWQQDESKQKRSHWQEVVFRVVENSGRLLPQGGYLVQIIGGYIKNKK